MVFQKGVPGNVAVRKNQVARHFDKPINDQMMRTLLFMLLVAGCLWAGSCQTGKSTLKEKGDLATSGKFSDTLHFSRMYEDAAMKYAFRGKTPGEFKRWQSSFRPELKRILGLGKLERQYAAYRPQARMMSSEDVGYAMREKWIIWTEPTVPLPFILLRPKNVAPGATLVLTPHGHSKNTELYAGIYHDDKERESGEAGERNVAEQAARLGYFALAPTTRGFGDTRTDEDIRGDATSSCHILLLHDMLAGRTPIGDRVWDISRLIDWAIANLPVDPGKVVVTGNSGGGTVSLFAAACDTRISVAIPASYFCTFTGSIGTLRHCECNYVPGILELGEMADVAGLIAPRPFCAIQGKEDPIFPIGESRKAFSHLQTIYAAAGVPGNCELYEGPGGHRYYSAGAWPFVRKHLGQVAK